MAKPITATPPVKGKDAQRIQDEIRKGTPNTPERLAFFRDADRIFAQVRDQLRPVQG